MSNVRISSEIGSEWRTTLGHPQLIECMGIRVLSLVHGPELGGSDVYPHIVKTISELKTTTTKPIQPEYVPLGGLCLDFFEGFF